LKKNFLFWVTHKKLNIFAKKEEARRSKRFVPYGCNFLLHKGYIRQNKPIISQVNKRIERREEK